MKPLELSPEARDELDRGVLTYENQRAGRGVRFASAVRAILDLIARHPKIGSPYALSYRKRLVADFPYAVFYSEYDDCLWIAAIYHGHRKPDGWMNRRRD